MLTKDELLQQRENLVKQKEEFWQKLNQALGAIELIDYWLAQIDKPTPAQEKESAPDATPGE